MLTFASSLATQQAWLRRATTALVSSRLKKPVSTQAAFAAVHPAPNAPLLASRARPMPDMSTPNTSSAPSDGAGMGSVAVTAVAAEPWRPALVHEDVVYNVALGSNMSEEKMRSRGATGRRRIVPLAPPVPCTVPGYALAFDLFGVPPVEPAWAGAVRRRVGDTGVLHGVLYKLSR